MTREQLEQQAERNRAAVADTLEELNERLTPGQMVDQVLGYMKGGGSEFVANLGRQVTNNPMPVTMIGAGLAWFLLARNSGAQANGSMGLHSGNGSSYNGSSYAKKGNGIGGAASDAAGKIGDMASATARGVSGAVQSVEDAASSAYHQAADTVTAAKDSAIRAEEKAVASVRSAIAFCQDQPLILAGIGLALGAAIGAALPATEMEDHLMGAASDDVKEGAKEIAVDQLDKAKKIGEKLGDALQEDTQPVDTYSGPSPASYVPQPEAMRDGRGY